MSEDKKDLLSKDEQKILKEEILKEIEQEAKDAEITRFKDAERKRQRLAQHLELPQEQVFIDLPTSSDGITIDGTKYMANTTYTVSKPQADTMREIIHRAWGHEAEIDGKPKDFFNKRRNTVLSPYGARNAAPTYGVGKVA